MSQYKAIPQPTDQRNVSQNDILTNFNYLQTPLNPGAGVANGVINVDHLSTGDNVAQPKCGFHNQVSLLNQSPAPTTLTNAVNGQNSDGIIYSKSGTLGSNLQFLNSSQDIPLSATKLILKCTGTGTILGNSFNVASVTGGGGSITVTMTTAMPDTNYLILATTSGNTPFIITYSGVSTTQFTINTFNIAGSAAASGNLSIEVKGIY